MAPAGPDDSICGSNLDPETQRLKRRLTRIAVAAAFPARSSAGTKVWLAKQVRAAAPKPWPDGDSETSCVCDTRPDFADRDHDRDVAYVVLRRRAGKSRGTGHHREAAACGSDPRPA